jgi:hypothetical protein
MSGSLAAVIAVVLVLALGAASLAIGYRYGTLRSRRQVIVALQEDFVVRGVLWRRSGAYLTLRDAEVISQENPGQPLKADGEFVVHRDRVRWVQVI